MPMLTGTDRIVDEVCGALAGWLGEGRGEEEEEEGIEQNARPAAVLVLPLHCREQQAGSDLLVSQFISFVSIRRSC